MIMFYKARNVQNAIVCGVLVLLMSFSSSYGTILFQDNFDDGNADGWEEYDGSFAVVDGKYRLESTHFSDDARSVVEESNWSDDWNDYTIDLDFKIERSDGSTHNPAILFRVQGIGSGTDQGRYYQLYIDRGGIAGFSIMDYGSVQHPLSTAYVLPDRYEWHHLTLEVIGTQASASIDGEHLLTYNNLQYQTGKIGLKTINDGVVLFDNVVVTPEPATILLLGLGSAVFLSRRRRRKPEFLGRNRR